LVFEICIGDSRTYTISVRMQMTDDVYLAQCLWHKIPRYFALGRCCSSQRIGYASVPIDVSMNGTAISDYFGSSCAVKYIIWLLLHKVATHELASIIVLCPFYYAQ
jgi:hypothetical protein